MTSAEPKAGPSGASAVAQRIREYDWSATPLGPLETWPGALTAAVATALASHDATGDGGPPSMSLTMDAVNAFLVRFSDNVLELTDPQAIAQLACQLVADTLHVERAYWAEVDWTTREYVIGASVHAPGVPVIDGRFPIEAWEPFTSDHLSGHAVVVDDTQADERIPPEMRAAYAQIAVGADLATPVSINGHLRCTLAVNQQLPRHWTEAEVALVRGVASRCWAAVERARVEKTLRQSEERLWRVLDGMGEGFGLLAPDFTILEHNREALRLDGRSREEVIGRSHWDIYPATEDSDLGQLLQHAMAERVPVALEHRYAWDADRARWLEMRAYPTADGLLAVFWHDVTERREAQDALRESEEQFRTVADLVPDLLWRSDPKGDTIWLNQRWLDYTGQSLDDAVGWGWADAIHRDEWEPSVENYRRAVETGSPLEQEHRIRRHDGAFRWFLVRAVPVRAEAGVVQHWFGAATDIHDRKLAEEATRENEERQAFLLQLGDALRACPDEPSVKETTVRMLGEHLRLDRFWVAEVFDEEGIALVGPEHVHPDLPPMAGRYLLADYPEIMRQLMTQAILVPHVAADPRFGEAERALLAGLHIEALLVVALRKGPSHVTWAFPATMATPRLWTDGERVLLEEVAERTWAAVERVRAEEALRESEARFRTVVQHLPDYAIFLLDESGVIIGWWEGAERVKGYTAPEVLGHHLSLFYTPEDIAAGVVAEELAVAARRGHYEGEGWRIRKGGERFWVNEIATAIRDDAGTVVGFTKISRDLTGRRMAEAALAESEQRFRLIVDRATDYAIFSTDAERRIETWPPGAVAVFGWSPAEAVGQLVDITFTPDDRAQGVPEQEFAEARETGHAPNVRWHVRQDGSYVFIEGDTYARQTEQGDFQGVFKIGQDITVRLVAEEARQEEEAARREEEFTLREELEAQVREATTELRMLSRRLLAVQEEERRRLALELHDEIGQVLTGLSFQLAAATNANGGAITEAQATVQALTEQVRRLSLDLRPAVLDRYGLLAALEWHIGRFQATTGITVHLRHHGLDQRFPPEVEIAAFRVVQEALTNIARHSGADFATVQVHGDGALTLVIRDTGSGFDPAQGSISTGLGGMRERVKLLGGHLEIESMPGGGTTIIAEFPAELPMEEAP